MNLEQARYIVAVAEFLDNPFTNKEGLRLKPICPECDRTPNPDDMDDPHAVLSTPTGLVVVIGCEGYKVVDPNRVGFLAPNWQPIDPTDGN